MIRIEHIALWADDIESLCAFYSHYFGAVMGSRYENVSKGFSSRFLSFESGARIEVMTTATLHPARHIAGAQRMGLTHFAITLGSQQAVNDMAERMSQAGVPVLDGPRRTGDGYYEAVVLDPEGNRIELLA